MFHCDSSLGLVPWESKVWLIRDIDIAMICLHSNYITYDACQCVVEVTCDVYGAFSMFGCVVSHDSWFLANIVVVLFSSLLYGCGHVNMDHKADKYEIICPGCRMFVLALFGNDCRYSGLTLYEPKIVSMQSTISYTLNYLCFKKIMHHFFSKLSISLNSSNVVCGANNYKAWKDKII